MTILTKFFKKSGFVIPFIIFFSLLIDQWTKFLALEYLPLHKIISVCPFFNLFLTYNQGVSFSLFSSNHPATPLFLSLMGISICLFVLYWLFKEKDFSIKLGLSFILGGAIGNIIDRLRFGYVIDFLDVYYQTHHWPAFNMADSFICLGAFIIFVRIFLKKEEESK